MKLTHTLAVLALLTQVCANATAEPLKVGDKAPMVTGTTETGARLALGDVYKKQPYTLVYFYPKADTKGCTAQGCSLRDAYEQLTKEGVAVIGVSLDQVDDQKAFKEKYNFPFTLLADPDRTVVNAFGVPVRQVAGRGDFASRQAYLIKDRKIIYTDHTGTTEKQAEVILKVLAGHRVGS
jgi:peroxiredoxin Q/BCP